MDPWKTDYKIYVVPATNGPASFARVRIESAGPNRVFDGGKLDDIVEATSSTP